MQTIKYGKSVLFLVLFVVQSSFAVTYTVKKGGGANFTTIQAAVDQARMGDEIVIMDTEIYSEQVTIDSTKTGLILRSEDPRALKKPTIKYQDKINVGPRDQDEALIDSLINFDQNGALQVLRARNVRIEGIAIDGGGAYPFGYDAVWEGRYALQHGNAALTLFVAGDCIIRDCDITNAYIGINVKDRNEGGVFANPNPADIDPENIIPFSGFAQTGNHLIEYNRIHNNSLGFFFESTWDLGSTIRYNLIYENHHQTAAIATKVKGLTSEGGNQGGGAFMFKDQMLSPLAIYNNTLWHNSILFLGNWKSGGQHLIFNNIYAEPNDYWEGSTTTFAISFDMSKAFVNRMHNSVYAAQAQLEPNNVRITNDLSVGQPATAGALIKPFPAAAEIRWVETPFLSTDPTSPDFLTPDWSDADVMEYIVDKGWETAGVKDFDGSRADLGAIPMGGGRPVDIVTIRPTVPIEIKSSTATISFKVEPRIGTMTELKVVMFGIVTRLDTNDVFGAEYPPITTTNIQKVSLGTQTIVLGPNTIDVQIPATGDFAFLEMIIEGVGSNGKKFTSAVGFLPYRKLDYTMKVTVLDKLNGTPITEVNAGQTVALRVETFYMGKAFTNKVDPTDVSLQTAGAYLWDPTGAKVEAMPGGIVNGKAETEVIFTKVPFGGEEFVSVAGRWIDGAKVVAFLGVSDGILVHAGPPDSIAIQRPSPLGDIINPGEPYTVTVQAFDHWGNVVDKPTGITCISTDTTKGKIGETAAVQTDAATGSANFHAYVTNGDLNDTFDIVATLVVKPEAKDTSFLIVGQARDRLFILYSDTLSYDVTKTIEGCSGERVPVTIRASKSQDGNVVEKTRNTPINLNVGSGLKAYATASSADPINATQLVSGQVVIYIQAVTKNVNDGTIGAVSSDPSIKGADRAGIYFKECFTVVDRGAFFTTNGRGAVDRADIYYTQALDPTEVPDSILLCWPNSTTDCRKVYKASGNIVQDPANPAHLIVTIPSPFTEATTKINGSNNDMATVFWVNPATPDAPSINQSIAMQDSVGPLLARATLIERLTDGDDTLIVTFTEPVSYEKLNGKTLTLISGGQKYQLSIKGAKPGSNQEVYVTVDNTLSAKIVAANDSLMITPTGTVSDNNGNKPHPENRPVVIGLRGIAPTLVSAYYRDGNGDGIVDTVRATFSKGIVLNDALGLKIKFVQKESQNADPAKMKFVDGTDNTTIDIQMDYLFSIFDLQDKTSGSMSVEALFVEFEGNNKSTIIAEDKAAPVLVAVEYHFGRMGDNSSLADWDTVFAKYSEPLQGAPSVDLPINFISSTGDPYDVPVFTTAPDAPRYVSAGPMTGYFQFIVSVRDLSVEGGIKGSNNVVTNAKDSAWINTTKAESNAVDGSSNAQKIANNKKVAVVTKKPPFSLKVEYGPNPYMPTEKKPFIINVTAKTKAAEKTTFSYNLGIYDKVGNLVHEEGKSNVVDKITIEWDGRNTTGRLVGNGTYISKLSVTYFSTNQPNNQYKHLQTIKIGVKRTN